MRRFSVLIFLLVASLARSQETEQRSVSETYELAQALYDTTERLQDALALFQEVAARDSSFCCWRSYVYIANIYLKWQKIDAAKAILEEAENCLLSLPKFDSKDDTLYNIRAYRDEVASRSLLDVHKVRTSKGWGEPFQRAPELIGGLSKMQNELEYPKDALEKGILDTVLVTFHLSWRGDVYFAKIRKGGKLQSIRDAAIKAVHKATWKPAMAGPGLPVCVWMTIPVKFNLKK